MSDISVTPIKAFKDNYIWLLTQRGHNQCLVIDPGNAAPVLAYLRQHQLQPVAILITHRHSDHVNGIAGLLQSYPNIPVYGPALAQLPIINRPLQGGEQLQFQRPALQLQVISTPGHTSDHIVFYGQGRLFCGDVLFSAGCGRIYDCSAEQLYHSLCRLRELPDSTQIYCAHEYTQANLNFAYFMEPNNKDIEKRRQEVDKLCLSARSSLPNTISNEKLTNPFLRFDKEAVIQSVISKDQINNKNFLSIFTRMRRLKDEFKA